MFSVIIGLRTHNTCNQGKKYIWKYTEQHCALIYAINSTKEYDGKKLPNFKLKFHDYSSFTLSYTP